MYNRIYVDTIDYLRGLLALTIMIYHYLSWSGLIIVNSNNLLFRFALYGVSIFFIISGFSLSIAHIKDNFLRIENILSFFKKRFARIYPLFFFVIILSIIINYRGVNNIRELLINLTISFGFLHYDSLTPGSWSIGIEVIFYTIFPIIFILSRVLQKVNFIFFVIVSMLIILLCIYYSSFENNYYIGMGIKYFYVYKNNFVNHIYFFIFGVMIAFVYYRYIKFLTKNSFVSFINKYKLIVLIIMLFLFYFPKLRVNEYFFPITEWNRVYFSFSSFLLFLVFLLLNFKSDILKFFGQISYTLYLTHPISLFLFRKFFKININYYNILLPIVFSILFSIIIYNLYEKPMQKLINNLRIN